MEEKNSENGYFSSTSKVFDLVYIRQRTVPSTPLSNSKIYLSQLLISVYDVNTQDSSSINLNAFKSNCEWHAVRKHKRGTRNELSYRQKGDVAVFPRLTKTKWYDFPHWEGMSPSFGFDCSLSRRFIHTLWWVEATKLDFKQIVGIDHTSQPQIPQLILWTRLDEGLFACMRV